MSGEVDLQAWKYSEEPFFEQKSEDEVLYMTFGSTFEVESQLKKKSSPTYEDICILK